MKNHNKTKQQLFEELAGLQRRVAEQEAQIARSRQAKADQRQINDNLPVLVATAGLDGYYKEVNAAFERILGWTEQESLSRPFMEFIHPADRAGAVETFERLKSGDAAINFVDRNICKDGSHRWINWIVIPLPNRNIVFGIGQDITERKRAEAELQQSHEELERRVAERTAELSEVNSSLQAEIQYRLHMLRASDHERQTIAYDIHDGLAQQLAAAIMQFQTYEHLKDHAPGKARRAHDAGMTMVRQAHCEARRLVNGVRPPALDELGVAVAIAHLIHEQRVPKGPQIEYHDDVEFDRLPAILENAIYRIAQESLANACRHSGSEKVAVSLIQHDDVLRLEVQDWGVGFDPEMVDESRFGLEGIRERTRLLNGKCSIESKPGKGTCVSVMLPMIGADRNGSATSY